MGLGGGNCWGFNGGFFRPPTPVRTPINIGSNECFGIRGWGVRGWWLQVLAGRLEKRSGGGADGARLECNHQYLLYPLTPYPKE